MWVRFPLGALKLDTSQEIIMKKDKNYLWLSIGIITFGIVIFLISLTSAMTNNKLELHREEKTFYFDRTILPDNVFYPILMAVDRLELELSNDEEKVVLQMDYAVKRLEAAKILLQQGKTELALVTLGKAHQYLLSANEAVREMEKQGKYLPFAVGLNKQFQTEYEHMSTQVSDIQSNQIKVMIEELKAVGGKL